MTTLAHFHMGTSHHWGAIGGEGNTPWVLVPECDIAALTDGEIGAMVRSLAEEARRTEAYATVSWLEVTPIRSCPEERIAGALAELEEFAEEPYFVPWYAALKEERDRGLRREARRIKDGGRYKKATIPQALRRQVFERDNHTCQICGATERLHADHIIPELEDGPTTLENLQTLCRKCNSTKGAR